MTQEAASAWTLELFGGIKARANAADGARVVEKFRTQKTAAVLALLALRGRRSRESLCALLWPDSAPEAARTSLSSALSALRRDMGEDILNADRHSVALAPNAVTTDVAAFDQALKQDDWARAVELYRGPLLPGFHEEPFPALANEYEEKARGAFHARLQVLEGGASSEAEPLRSLARRAIAVFVDDERWFLSLMRASRMSGDVDAALRVYESLQRWARKNGEVASEEARALAKYLRRDREQQSARVPAESDAQAPAEIVEASDPVANLPHQWTRFFGREAERELLWAWLRSGEKLVTLSGAGGSGKTRLAIEALREAAPAWSGSVHFVPLASLSDAELLFSTVRDALGLAVAPDMPPLEQLERALRGKRRLLLLDNFEQLAERGAPLLQQLRERLPEATFLVTSRIVLRLPGEREFPIAPLPTPLPVMALGEIEASPSAALFLDRSGIRLERANAESIAALCRRLDGIPLALELAAARAKVLAPAQILERLSTHPNLLKSREMGVPERHQTLRAAIEWSVDLLSPELRRFFARASVFRGGWTLEAAEAVCAPDVCEEWEAIDFLQTLRDHSLLLTEEGPGGTRYRLLETLREWSQEQIEGEEKASLQRRHFDFHLSLAESTSDAASLAQRGSELEREVPNFRAALSWALEQSDPNLAVRLAGVLGGFWEMRSLHSEGRDWTERALQKGQQQTIEPPLLARLQCAAGAMLFYCGDYRRAQSLLEEGLEWYRGLGDEPGEALALDFLGKLCVVVGRSDDTRRYGEAALAIARRHNDLARLLSSLITAAWGCHNTGFYKQALRYFDEGSQLASAFGERRAVAVCEATKPFALLLDGDEARAEAACRASLEACDERAGAWANAFLRGTVGVVLLRLGDIAGARRLLPGVAFDFLAISTRWEVASLLFECGHLAIELEDFERATLLWGAAQELSERVGYVMLPCLSIHHRLYQQRLAAALSPHTREELLARGRTLTLDESVALTQKLA